MADSISIQKHEWSIPHLEALLEQLCKEVQETSEWKKTMASKWDVQYLYESVLHLMQDMEKLKSELQKASTTKSSCA
ncbi:hypothetical protein FKM82_028280 [Ascaphus truei]